MKRLLDIAISGLGLAVLAPILFVMAVWIRLDSRGPALYRSARVGRGERLFRIIKFRTMVVDAERLGGSSTSADDPRLTRAGRLLRAGKLDELPQLWNVLRGDMSLVGPRPQVEWAVKLYAAEEREILTVRPGITDYASIRFRNEGSILSGSSDPDRDYLEKIAPEKIRLGRYYVRTYSVWMDTMLILATVGAILGLGPDWILPSFDRVASALDLRVGAEAGRSPHLAVEPKD